jgi:hypothetical protein
LRPPSFVALEIDDAIQPLVAAAAMLGGDHAMMIAAVGADLADGQRLLRLELGQTACNRSPNPLVGRARSDCKI